MDRTKFAFEVLKNVIDGNDTMDITSAQHIRDYTSKIEIEAMAKDKQIAELQEKLSKMENEANFFDACAIRSDKRIEELRVECRKDKQNLLIAKDKIHRRNLQIADLKKLLAKRDKTIHDCISVMVESNFNTTDTAKVIELTHILKNVNQ